MRADNRHTTHKNICIHLSLHTAYSRVCVWCVICVLITALYAGINHRRRGLGKQAPGWRQNQEFRFSFAFSEIALSLASISSVAANIMQFIYLNNTQISLRYDYDTMWYMWQIQGLARAQIGNSTHTCTSVQCKHRKHRKHRLWAKSKDLGSELGPNQKTLAANSLDLACSQAPGPSQAAS